MKFDRDMMSLLKATKKAALPPGEILERIRKSTAVRRHSVDVATSETADGSDIAN